MMNLIVINMSLNDTPESDQEGGETRDKKLSRNFISHQLEQLEVPGRVKILRH